MKRFILMLCFSMIFLLSCNQKETSEYLEFPKTNWDMTMEQVMEAYGVEEKDASYMEDGYFEIVGHKIFGEKTGTISFHFGDVRGITNKLIGIEVEYPEDANMKKVLKNMIKTYGNSVPFVNFISYHSVFDSIFSEFPNLETENVKVWSTGTLKDNIPEEKSNQYKEMWAKYLGPIQYDDNWEKLLLEGSLVTVGWTNQNEIGIRANVNSLNNKLYFDAMHLKVYQYIQEEISK